jgi:ABC-type transport system involved in cytochrome bd biosynthesis fused ATPase/permease subunit
VPLLLAAARYEEFVREHSPLMAAVVFVLLALLVVRLVVRTMTRVVLLGTLLLLTLFVYVERTNIRECTQYCECTIAGFDIDVPACDRNRLALASR